MHYIEFVAQLAVKLQNLDKKHSSYISNEFQTPVALICGILKETQRNTLGMDQESVL